MHTYASLDEFNDFISDDGSTVLAAEDATIKTRKLAVLEAASRRIDEWCDRSRFGSGFGPRTGTNRYTPDGSATLALDDDLLSITSVAVLDEVGGTSTTFTDETDFYKHPFDSAPYRRLVCHRDTDNSSFFHVLRGTSVVASWGYQDVRTTQVATITVASSTTTTATLSADADGLSLGDTIRAESEQLYITAKTATTLTVERGANGTTAATHAGGTTISRYQYPDEVVDATLRLALMRWKARDAGADGTDGGGEMPTVAPRSSERSILLNTIGHLRLPRGMVA